MWKKIALSAASALFAAAAVGTAAYSAADPDYLHPLIKNAGKAVHDVNAEFQPKPASKIVFDVTASESSAKVVGALDDIALYLNLAAAEGVPPESMKLVAVLHGDATIAAVNDDYYAERTDAEANPNRQLLKTLSGHGVEVYVCQQALAHRQIPKEQVLPEVEVAASAMTALVNLQMNGYALLPG